MKSNALAILIMAACCPSLSADSPPQRLPRFGTCSAVHGRAAYYNGGSWFRIWAVGTHHIYWIEDSGAGKRFEPFIKDFDHFVYADFVLCPTSPFAEGSMQGAKIQSFRNVRIALRN
jgi:hypothetical protein